MLMQVMNQNIKKRCFLCEACVLNDITAEHSKTGSLGKTNSIHAWSDANVSRLGG